MPSKSRRRRALEVGFLLLDGAFAVTGLVQAVTRQGAGRRRMVGSAAGLDELLSVAATS